MVKRGEQNNIRPQRMVNERLTRGHYAGNDSRMGKMAFFHPSLMENPDLWKSQKLEIRFFAPKMQNYKFLRPGRIFHAFDPSMDR